MEAVITKRKRGLGNLTPTGYIRYRNGQCRFQHRRVWEKHNGPIPRHQYIHHIDGDKTNNSILNLMLVDTVTHKRLHGECELRNGVWWKPCRKCREFKMMDTEFYFKEGYVTSRCKKCLREDVKINSERNAQKLS